MSDACHRQQGSADKMPVAKPVRMLLMEPFTSVVLDDVQTITAILNALVVRP